MSLRNHLGGEDGSPQGSPGRIDSVETTKDAPEQKQRVRFFQRKNVSEEANAELMMAMTSLAILDEARHMDRGQPRWKNEGECQKVGSEDGQKVS